MRHQGSPFTLAVALVAAATSCDASGLTRPASQAEREAAGLDDPDTVVLVQSHRSGEGGTRAPAIGFDYQTRIGTAFVGRSSGYAWTGEPPSVACTSGTTEIFASATLDLPDGAQIRYVDTFGFDSDGSNDLRTFLVSLCQGTYEAGEPVYVLHGDVQSSGSPGNFVSIIDLDADPLPVSRGSCKYIVRARFAALEQCVGGSIFLDKMRVGYTTP
jgi:hypothetical protein